MSKHLNTLANIQEIYFDICDLQNGQSYQSIGYDNRRECFSEMLEKLARIESEFKELTGLQNADE